MCVWGGGGSFAQNVDVTRHDFQLYDVIDIRLARLVRIIVLPFFEFSFYFADTCNSHFPNNATC